MTNKLILIGAGGIGSFSAREIHELIINDQIDIDNVEITIVDDDLVEYKNIKYQNFNKEDITKPKAKVIGERYNFYYEQKRIEKSKDLDPYDIIMICVDNPKTRLLVFDHCIKNNKFFIDARAEGKSIALFTKDGQKLEELKKTLGNMEGSTSCQLKYRLDNNIVDLGNKIVAVAAVQCLLNYLRGETNPKQIIQTF